MLRAGRSVQQEKKVKERQRELVLKALTEKYLDQSNDRLLSNIIAAVPRTTPKMIEETLKKVKAKDEVGGAKLEDALNHCQLLAQNLDGASPDVIWTDPVRVLWAESLGAILGQTANWKATPLVVVHPFCGKVAVLTSLSGKFQAQNEYARMKDFELALRDGLDEVLEEIHPVRDNMTGLSLKKHETQEILANISAEIEEQKLEAELSENVSEEEEDEEDYQKYNAEVEEAVEDWSSDPPPSPQKKNVGKQPIDLTSTPSTSTFERSNSSTGSSFFRPMPGVESPLQSTKIQAPTAPLIKPEPKAAVRTLFGKPDDRTTPTLQKTPTETPPLSPAQVPKLSEVFPQGYSIIPHKQKNSKKNEPRRKSNEKKRPIGSPNYPASKNSRLEATEAAIQHIQMNQTSQSELIQTLSNQIGQLAMNLAINMSKQSK